MPPARASSRTLDRETLGKPGRCPHWDDVRQPRDRHHRHGALSSYPPKLVHHGSKRPAAPAAQWLNAVGSPITLFPSTPDTNPPTGAITSPSVTDQDAHVPSARDSVAPAGHASSPPPSLTPEAPTCCPTVPSEQSSSVFFNKCNSDHILLCTKPPPAPPRGPGAFGSLVWGLSTSFSFPALSGNLRSKRAMSSHSLDPAPRPRVSHGEAPRSLG